MDTQQITYFLDVAKTEHMTRSAKRLDIAQPALSRSIARLEAEVGAPLFLREGRGLKLTPEGKLLQEHLSRAAAEITYGIEQIHDAQSNAKRTVHVQAKAASLVAINSIAGWLTKNPESRIELVQSESAEADVAVGSMPFSGALEQSRFSEHIMIAAPATTGLGPTVLPEQIADMRLISLAPSSGFRQACDAACTANGIAPQTAFESDNSEAVRKAIALGLGIGFWPELSWGRPGDGIHLLPVDAPSFKRTIYVALLKGGTSAQGFYRHLAHDVSRAMQPAGQE